jgi:hypothetical protein
MSTTTPHAVLRDPGPGHRPEPAPESRPVLAVLLEDAPVDHLLERASALARERGTAVLPLLLQVRLPFSTDPALVDRLARRRRDDLDQVQRALASCPTLGGSLPTELLLLAVPPLPQRARRAWREVESVARDRSAAVVVVPPILAAVAASPARHGTSFAVAVVGGPR